MNDSFSHIFSLKSSKSKVLEDFEKSDQQKYELVIENRRDNTELIQTDFQNNYFANVYIDKNSLKRLSKPLNIPFYLFHFDNLDQIKEVSSFFNLDKYQLKKILVPESYVVMDTVMKPLKFQEQIRNYNPKQDYDGQYKKMSESFLEGIRIQIREDTLYTPDYQDVENF